MKAAYVEYLAKMLVRLWSPIPLAFLGMAVFGRLALRGSALQAPPLNLLARLARTAARQTAWTACDATWSCIQHPVQTFWLAKNGRDEMRRFREIFFFFPFPAPRIPESQLALLLAELSILASSVFYCTQE